MPISKSSWDITAIDHDSMLWWIRGKKDLALSTRCRLKMKFIEAVITKKGGKFADNTTYSHIRLRKDEEKTHIHISFSFSTQSGDFKMLKFGITPSEALALRGMGCKA